WRQVQTRGRYAEYPRVTHAAMVHPQHATWLLIHGGYGGDGPTLEFLDDLCVLDTDSLSWHDLNPSGSPPPARGYHSMTNLAGRAVVFGGKTKQRADKEQHSLWAYDPLTSAWEQPTVAAGGPHAQPRSNHAATGVGGGMAVVHGGRVKKERLDDLWLLQ
ncbi:unnamed protein product, partial [Closterium sp. NIES-53]